MLTILNLGIILALLIMMAIWATYGFFSAFIQLIIVIASGVIALALWEPLTYALIGRMPAYAHGVGLLAPFVLLLIILRVAFDKLCRANVHMPRLADQIGGAACGLCSGILAFGLLLNGANFLPMERDVLGWEPYKVQGTNVTDNPDGKLWGVTRIHEWSAGFYGMLSNGAMSPTGGTPLAVARPNLAKRAVLTRLPVDKNQFRTAHPGNVQVTGVYAIPATKENVYGLAQRSAILAFIKPSYEMPETIEQDETGLGLVNYLLNDLQKRIDNPVDNGKPSEMLNVEAIIEVARTPQFKYDGAATAENFPGFVEMVADKMGKDLMTKLEPVLGEGKVLYIVDTAWNNEHQGTFGTDNKLRIAMTQVGLQAGDKMIPPIGYSIEYSQKTGGRIFTEIISDEADVEARDMAYSKFTQMSMGWVFPLNKGDKPQRFFIRELRFDLSKLKKPEGQEGIVNQNIGSVAQVVGAPLLPSPADLTTSEEGGTPSSTSGVRIAGTDTFAEVDERLPGAFSGSAVNLDFDKDADPWQLNAGSSERITPGKGGRRSSVREISVRSTDRLIRIEVDGNKAKSLYGRALGLAENLNVIGVKDEGGNFYDSIGFALLRKDRSMHIDIREGVANRGVSANELPEVRAGEKLMVYFQVPVGTKVTAFVLSGKDQDFEEALEATTKKR
ncbi:MAG: CvpA family protein [Planctomycetota bacterium]